MSSKWEIVEVRAERELDLRAVGLLVAKVVVSIAIAVSMFYVVSCSIDKEAQFNENVLNAHITSAQRTAVIERGIR